MKPESWLPVVGYEGIYEVSDYGRVRGVDRIDSCGRRWHGRIMRQRLDSHGYFVVCLTRDSEQIVRKVHRLVLRVFKGAPPEVGMECAHLDGTRTNNVPTNLIWASRQENADHIAIHGTADPLRGEFSMFAKLRRPDVLRIREATLFGATRDDLAELHGVSRSNISLIVHRRTWTHV